MYNYNKYCLINKREFITVIYETIFAVYEMMYNRDICSYYIRRYIITTNISIIHENIFLIIQDDV